MKNRIAIIVSNIYRAVSHEWIVEALHDHGYEVHFILLNEGDSLMEEYLLQRSIRFIRIRYTGKSDIPISAFKIWRYLRSNKINIVHTHLFEASIIGLAAAKLAGIKKRVCSRHHSTYHHDFFPFAVKYDRFINNTASDLIAASKVVQEVLTSQERVPPSKVHLIHHGFKLELFKGVTNDAIESMKLKHEVTGYPVIGVIARWTWWKGIHHTIEAFSKLLIEYPNAQIVLANASGDYEMQIRKLLTQLPENSYRVIRFEERFEVLYQLFDVFVHVPINERCEAFGQVYVEALAAGIPSVFTLSGVAQEFVVHDRNAVIVEFQDSVSIYSGIKRIIMNTDFANQICENGQHDVEQLFTFKGMIDKYEQVYQL